MPWNLARVETNASPKPWSSLSKNPRFNTTVPNKIETRKPTGTKTRFQVGTSETDNARGKKRPNGGTQPNLVDPEVESPQRKLSTNRNKARLHKANKADKKTMSKYLKTSEPFIYVTVRGPDDGFDPPAWLMTNIRAVAGMAVPTPKPPIVMFQMTQEAAEHNTKILEEHSMDFDWFLRGQQETTLAYGSEFRPVEQLRLVLGNHPLFAELETILTKGMDYRFETTIPEAKRLEEVSAMIQRGNHKSAEKRGEHVAKALSKDVIHGFSMPITADSILSIPGAMVQPLGMAEQLTLAESGERVPKFRLTQDLSFSLTEPNLSVNSRIDMAAYPEMVYGWCLLRIVHFIVALRAEHPQKRIFITKYDYSDAYRRITHAASAAKQSIALFGGLAFVALRLTFGGSPNPPTWCLFSEMVTDLANELLLCRDWDPASLYNPDQPTTPTAQIRGPTSSLGKASPLSVHVPTSSTSRVDGFIDDLICVFLDTEENHIRAPHAVPLAMFVTSRPHAGDNAEPVTRRNILSLPKLLAEGSPDEAQIVLGWFLDARLLEIRLPKDKFDAWSGDVLTCITKGRSNQEEMDTLVGRLNHTATVIPLSRHFLDRLRNLIDRHAFRTSGIPLSTDVIKDLKLWLTLLTKAARGISLNLVTVRRPTRVCWSDACPFGIGGYSTSGRAWRVQIPTTSSLFGHPGVNNLLEFLGMVINVWLECEDARNEHECILALGDNTSAIGWLFSSSKFPASSPAHKAHLLAARQLATLLLHEDHCLASQHIKGEQNLIADLLSFAGTHRGKRHPIAHDNPSDSELTQRFHIHYPSQIPENFSISPLPRKILSWLTMVLRTHESYLTLSKRVLTKQPIGVGDVGWDSVITPASTLTPSSLPYPTRKPTSSLEPFCPAFEPLSGASTADLQGIVNDQWFHRLSERPQATWLRRFGSVSNRAPSTSKEERPSDLGFPPS